MWISVYFFLCVLLQISAPSIDQLQEATKKIEELNKEQESLIDIFSEERERRELEEENLRKKLKVSLFIL